MRNGETYRYPMAGIASSLWERLILSLLKTLAGLSVVYLDFALLLLIVRESSIVSSLFPSTWALEICNALGCG